MTGLFFCLASDTVQGFYFVRMQYSPIQAFTARFVLSMQLCRPRHKTAHRTSQGRFLRLRPLNRPRYQTDTSGYNTTCATLEGIHAPGRAQQIQDTTATLGRCTAQHSRPIIIRYIKVQGCAPVIDPCQTVQHIADHASPAASRYLPRPAACDLAPVSSQGAPACTLHPAGQSSSKGAAGGAELLTVPPYLFSGFRPIANKGQK